MLPGWRSPSHYIGTYRVPHTSTRRNASAPHRIISGAGDRGTRRRLRRDDREDYREVGTTWPPFRAVRDPWTITSRAVRNACDPFHRRYNAASCSIAYLAVETMWLNFSSKIPRILPPSFFTLRSCRHS